MRKQENLREEMISSGKFFSFLAEVEVGYCEKGRVEERVFFLEFLPE